jgi:putative acetyltransferase
MSNAYRNKRSVYYIIENDNKIFGGAGISKLKNSNENICELQKMYFLEEARGIGMGKIMIEKCLSDAKNFGYKKCYIETMINMKSAQKLYLSQGFKFIEKPLGNTGHNACPVWMIKKIL